MSYPHETDGDELDGLVERPVVSKEAQCQECDEDLFQVESSFACQNPPCSRYAVPVNEYGNTDAEQEAEAQADGERRETRGASNY